MELRSVEPGLNRYRRYCLSVQFGLDGGGELIIAWGRIGRPMRSRVERFMSGAALERRYRALLARRYRHAYQAPQSAVRNVPPGPAGASADVDPAIDCTTRYQPLRQSNGYVGVFDGLLQTFVVRNTDLDVAVPLARSFNSDPAQIASLVAAAG
jgi:predicted DNA-binding WGR domain protein